MELALEKLSEAKTLLAKVNDMEKDKIRGTTKLRKRIQAEVKFLNKEVESGREIKENHVLCSNLGQLAAISTVASAVTNVTGLLQPFSVFGLEKVVVDVVADTGKQWIKVIMRNPKALHLIYISGGSKKAKPLDEVAADFVLTAEHHQILYTAPKIMFWFCRGVSEGLASALESSGVQVHGDRIPDSQLGLPDYTIEEDDEDDCSKEEANEKKDTSKLDQIDKEAVNGDKKPKVLSLSVGGMRIPLEKELFCEKEAAQLNLEIRQCLLPLTESSSTPQKLSGTVPDCNISGSEQSSPVHKINLDITAMVAYVSATANGGANFIFQDKLLTEQAEWERKSPVKETLDNYFKGSVLLACKEAVDHFQSIVDTIGGEGERARAKELLSRVTVVPTVDTFKDHVRERSHASERARLVFGTGHAYHALTVSSNGRFFRAVEQQSVNLAVLFHQPRALTEAKESTATPI